MLNFKPQTILKKLMLNLKPRKIAVSAEEPDDGEAMPSFASAIINAPAVQQVAARIFCLIIGFAAGNMTLPFDAAPAGIALVSSAPVHLPYIYAGTMLSLLTQRSHTIVYMLLYTICFAVRMAYEKKVFGEIIKKDVSSNFHLLLTGAGTMIAATVMLLMDGVNFTSVLRILMLVLVGLLLSIILSGLRVGLDSPPADTALAGAAFIIIYSIQSFTLISLTPAVILSVAATLATSKIAGPAKGALLGVACAIATGKSFIVGAVALMGLAGGLFFQVSDALAVTAGAVCAIAYVMTGTSLMEAQTIVPDIMFGCVLFLPIRILTDKLKLTIAKPAPVPDEESGSTGTTYMPTRGVIATSLPSRRLDSLSTAFGELNEVFMELAEKFKKPPLTVLKHEMETTLEQSCEKCPMKDDCASREFIASSATAFECVEMLNERGKLSPANLPPRISMRCALPNELCSALNTSYNMALAETLKTDKTSLLAKWYQLIGKLLKNASRDGHDDINFCREQSEHIFASLDDEGMPVSNVVVMGSRVKSIYLFGICDRLKEIPSDDVRRLCEKIMGCPLTDPEYSEQDGGTTLHFASVNRIRAERAFSTSAKGEENNPAVNGDSVVFFDSPDDFYSYSLICDGMGSGRQAALASRLACLLTEKLLCAGSKKEMTIELLNTVLLSTGEECFTTVDLLEVDLISQEASFIKAGAAPAFILRRGSIFKIQSASVPVGIVNSINAELTTFRFETGDIVVMLSDGVISSYEEGAWLLEMLEREGASQTLQQLADNICAAAKKRSTRKDDVTCAVVQIQSA